MFTLVVVRQQTDIITMHPMVGYVRRAADGEGHTFTLISIDSQSDLIQNISSPGYTTGFDFPDDMTRYGGGKDRIRSPAKDAFGR
jgi:hypothetical protein